MTVRREKILSCACDLYLDDGLDGFSMRKLARTVGVTAPALYRHYDSKESVLVAVVGEAYKLFAQYLYRALSGRTPLERFERAGEEYLNFALEHPRMYEMLYVSPNLLGRDQYPPEVAEPACATGQFWVDRVRECMSAGLLVEQDPEAVSTTMWAHAHGLMVIYLRGMLRIGEAEFRQLFGESCGRILVGVGTEGAAAWGAGTSPEARAVNGVNVPETGRADDS